MADKLVDIDVCSSTACNFCINGEETNPHLFLECPFTQRVMQIVFHQRCNVPPSTWFSWYQWLTDLNTRNIHNCISILAYQIIIYSVWRERNNTFFREEYSTPVKLAADCLHLIKCRLLSSNWFATESLSNVTISTWILDGRLASSPVVLL
ncbi:hypothetical protein DCAR_0101111 [Daucus carota subsp. sativus]|uniref:Reverse transcriptase zinc-binding domain-containing protein n=1 Tax=Daucus carota subsp. sativus TaxID=79200 RepID=A0AAF0W5G4_DAUCS|nr:hypothetical protein DCAR_0101111 [Daucus carota subsp. sativus]